MMGMMRKIRRKWKMVIAVVLVLVVVTILGIGLEGEERRAEGEPDIVSSMIVNNEQYLTVVANRNEIENKEEFTKLLIKMYEENSFHSVKFSRDMVEPEKIYMKIYLWKDEVKKNQPNLGIEFSMK